MNRPGDASSPLAAALAYAHFGWRVIPLHAPLPDGGCTCGRTTCAAAGKHPRIAAWQRDASRDPERIKTWWKQWPEANVGLLMGQEAGVIAIDVDPRNGGGETLEKLQSEHEALPATVKALTGGGGIHYLFAAPSGRPVQKNNNGAALGPGLDLQGERSLIVAAPSLHASGAHYKWADGCAPWERELAPLPAWVLALVDAAAQQKRVGKAPRGVATLPDVILEGARDETLFLWASYLRGQQGLEEDEILARLRKENAARCKPPLSDDDLRKIARSVAEYPRGEAGQGRRSVATVLADLALEEGIDLWHTPEGEQFATVWRDGHAEHWPLKSSAFTAWLAGLYYARTRHVAKDSAVKDARLALMARADEGQQVRAYTRVAEHDGAIYLDLADDKWRAVKITPAGWEVVSNPPVRFRRSRGQLPLPVPARDGTLDELRRFVNTTDEEWPLIAAWLLFAFRPDDDAFGDFPVLILGGQQGSAKSTISSILKRLIDPHDAELRSTIRNEHDLAIAARRSWVLALDNLSAIQLWMSDALCRLATGTAFTTRVLYTDDEEMVFSAKRPILLNGIGDLATRGDLLERALLITCPRIPADARLPKTKFWKDFEAAWPRLLGAVLDCVCGALAELPKVELASPPRMADFAIFATAAARAGAYGEKEFWDAYGASQADAHAIALEASPVAQAVLALLEDAGGGWKGTATGLLDALAGYADEPTRRLQAWPKSAKGLSKALDTLAENLRAVGVTVTRNRRGTAREIILTRSSDARGDASDAEVTQVTQEVTQTRAREAKRGAGFAPNSDASDASDAKMTESYPLYTDDPRGERKGEAAEEGSAKPGVENSEKCVTSVTSVTADADDPADDEEIDTCACGRPADRYTPVGEPICSACVEGASARQEEVLPLTDDDFIIADGEEEPACGESEVVL